jgi:hypothetical protein
MPVPEGDVRRQQAERSYQKAAFTRAPHMDFTATLPIIVLISPAKGTWVNRRTEVKLRSLRAARILSAVAAGSLLIACATEATASAAPNASASSARALTLNTAEQHQLLGLYASHQRIPVDDIASIRPGSAHVARASNGTLWALEGFTPKASAPLKVRVSFQDGADTGVFTQLPGKAWTIQGLGRSELACDASIPAAILHSWGYPTCAASTTAAPASPVKARNGTAAPAASAVGSQIASIADKYVGLEDNPPETEFSQTADCNPFTDFENPSAPDAGCGVDSTFDVQDHSEEWCADFAKWVWSEANVSGPLSDLTPGAASFYAYGEAEGESMPVDPPASDAAVGDAIVLYPAGTTPNSGSADHVGIITGVNTSAGTIDTVNGDFQWGESEIEVADTGYLAPGTFADEAEPENSSEGYIFVAPAGASAPTLSNTYLAQMQDNDSDLYGYNYGTNEPTTLGMDPGSGPSTIGLSDDSTYVTAFQDNASALYLHYSTGTNVNTGLGMDAGTSPSVAALSASDGWEAAIQDNDHVLYLRSSGGTNDNTGLGMDAGTSPAIAGSGGGWIAAFQDNDNLLYITTSAGLKYETSLGMASGTSPAITALANGGFVVAFQANSGDLYTLSVAGTSSTAIADGTRNATPYGMEAGTSPSIASFTNNSWRVAFQTNDQDLYTYSSAGSDDTSSMQMDGGSSPAITCLPDGSYEVAFEANNNGLDIYHTGSTNNATGLGMLAGTSPSISSPYL